MDRAAEQDRDAYAVILFSDQMINKLHAHSEKGRSGWPECTVDQLKLLLAEACRAGDMVTVGNYAMMIFHVENRTFPSS